MRTVNYDRFKNEVRQRKEALPSLNVRAIRRKPRDRQELLNLIHIAQLRKDQALASKEYEILAPRRWRINGVQHSE